MGNRALGDAGGVPTDNGGEPGAVLLRHVGDRTLAGGLDPQARQVGRLCRAA
jgi:hypothetical protein